MTMLDDQKARGQVFTTTVEVEYKAWVQLHRQVQDLEAEVKRLQEMKGDVVR